MEKYCFNKKSTFTFGLIFVSLIVIYLLALYLSALLPSEKIRTNIRNSVLILNDTRDWIDPFAFKDEGPLTINVGSDALMMNVIYNIDPNSPFKSILLNKFYGNSDFYLSMPNLNSTIKGDASTEYVYGRYWHGYIAVLSPLLIFFNYVQLRTINLFVFSILLFLFIIYSTKKLGYFVALALSLSFVYINFWCIPMAFQYLSVFYIALIASLIVLAYDTWSESFYLKLLFISASLTAFFDLLSAPLITFGLPLIFIFMKHENFFKNQSFKQIFLLLFRFALFWALGYLLTWLMKMIIVSVMYPDIIPEFMRQTLLRVNGVGVGNTFLKVRYFALYGNIKAIFCDFEQLHILVFVLFILSWLLFRKKDKFSSISYVYIILSIIPYIWYLFAASHSWVHRYFTYRLQMITILGFLLAYKESIDMEKLKSSFMRGYLYLVHY